MKGIEIPQGAVLVGKDGNKIIIHVNQKHIKSNATRNTKLPFYTVKVGGRTLYAWEVIKTGPSKLEDHSDAPLGCGARAYDVTYSPVVLLDGEGNSFEGLTFTRATALYGEEFSGMEDTPETCPLPQAETEPTAQDTRKYADDLRAPHCGTGGISFYNLKDDETVHPAGDFKEFRYEQTYVPTGRTDVNRVACRSTHEAHRLAELWSRGDTWKYRILPA